MAFAGVICTTGENKPQALSYKPQAKGKNEKYFIDPIVNLSYERKKRVQTQGRF
jgi:hypothetical protein